MPEIKTFRVNFVSLEIVFHEEIVLHCTIICTNNFISVYQIISGLRFEPNASDLLQEVTMNIGIVYASKTGNTKKMAETAATFWRNHGHEVTLKPIEEYDYANEVKYDILLIGSYCDSNQYPKIMRKFFQNQKANSCLSSFVTHATYDAGPYYEKWAMGCATFFKKYCDEHDIVNKGYFHCRGKPSKAIRLFVRMIVIKGSDDWFEYQRNMDHFPGEKEYKRFDKFLKLMLKA
jgi:flavodoxin